MGGGGDGWFDADFNVGRWFCRRSGREGEVAGSCWLHHRLSFYRTEWDGGMACSYWLQCRPGFFRRRGRGEG